VAQNKILPAKDQLAIHTRKTRGQLIKKTANRLNKPAKDRTEFSRKNQCNPKTREESIANSFGSW